MNQKKNLLIVILLCANLTATVILAGAFFIHVEKPGADLSKEDASSINFESKENGKYTLYIGTNDKDTIIRETHIKNMYWKPHSLTD